MMGWSRGRCGGNKRCCRDRKGRLLEPKCFSCIGWPFLLGQAIITAYHGHAKENLCKEVLAKGFLSPDLPHGDVQSSSVFSSEGSL